ncbi:hypothetical protein MPDQ_004081 [Monascus purpureus]|uniref:NADH-ubiquinone oxidoreductase 178 kDa subunit n=1 Tax=Monascus purpureus TaxID=5098 RepID=A0A507R1M0_MONPU|nr:hypothetical protein MPDQ_004081 [Monascus purpureus]BDD57877.1 hypothetical protein MAP00_003202 [Monascus purpureus]
MFAARRSVAPVRQLLRHQPRRFDSHAAHHAAPVNESFGRSFYVTVGTFAFGYVLYRIHKSYVDSDSTSFISNLIAKWTPDEKIFEERNAVHTVLMEKAAHDRHLFESQGGGPSIQLRTPELLNSGSQMNVTPGFRPDISAVAAHYERQNQQLEEARVARMKDGKVVSPYE